MVVETPPAMKCHARLTKWSSRIHIGTSKMYALQLFVCNRVAEAGVLCKVCVKKSLTHPRHEPRLHGLLTEPIPEDSHIFGGAWYMRMVERFGSPDLEWVVAAEVSQKIGEGWVEGAWAIGQEEKEKEKEKEKAQSDSLLNTKDMKDTVDASKKLRTKKLTNPSKKGLVTKATTEPVPQTKEIVPIAHFDILYQETADPIVTLPTDSISITKGVFRGMPVWILPDGGMFDTNSEGNPNTLLDETYS